MTTVCMDIETIISTEARHPIARILRAIGVAL
jgi:hypothetical protein